MQPGGRLGLPVGKRGLRPHPDGQAEFSDQRIVAAFDRYLEALDVSASISAHEDGEREFIGRYMAQNGQRPLPKRN